MAQLRGMFDPPSDEEEPTPGGATRPPLGSMFDAPPDETSIAAGGGTSATLAMSGRRQQQPPSLATMFDAPPTHDGTGTKAAGGLGGSGVDGAPTRPAASEKSGLLETAERRQQGYSKPGSRESQALSRQDTLGASHSAAGGSGLENMQLGSMEQADGDDPAVGVRRRASTRFGAGWLLLNDTYIPESWDEEKAQDDASADEASVVRTLTCFQRISRQLTMQVVPGVLAFMVCSVVVIAFASSVCAHPRLVPYVGFAVQIGAVGTAAMNLISMRSKIPYNVSSHDLFVVPFFVSIGSTLADHIEDDDELARTFFFTIMLSVTTFGGLIFLAGGSPFLRIAEFTPLPVVSGLVAGVGIGILQAAIKTQTAGSFTVWDVLFCALAMACSASMMILERMGYPTSSTFVPVYTGVTLTFYLILTLGGAPAWAWAEDNKAFFSQEYVDKRAWTVWTSGFLFGGGINLTAMASCVQLIFSYLVLNLLRNTLQLQATLRIVKIPGDDKHELRVMGMAHMVGGLLGSFGTINNLGVTATCMGFGGTHRLVPGGAVGVLTLVFFFTGFGPLAVVPKFVFAAILANTGVVLIQNNLVKPCQTLPRGEAVILCIIVFISVTGGKMMAVSAGAIASVMLFVYNWYRVGCIKYEASGLTWHSSVERTELSVEWLEEHGDRIQIVQLQGYLFFGNATQARERVREILEDQAPLPPATPNDVNTNRPPREPLEEPVEYIILDLTLVIGLDANALTALDDTAGLSKTHGVELILSGAQEEVGDRLTNDSAGESLSRARHFSDLDEALSYCEDRMLSRVGHERYGANTVTSTPTVGAGSGGGMKRVQSARPEIWIHGQSHGQTALSTKFERPMSPMPTLGMVREQSEQGERNEHGSDDGGSLRGSLDGGGEENDAAAAAAADLAGPQPLEGLSAPASAPSTPPRPSAEDPGHGFKRWLKMASSRYSFSTDRLLPLAEHTKSLTLQKGQVLMNKNQHGAPLDMKSGGLWFLENGLVSKSRDPDQSINKRSLTRKLKSERISLQGGLRHFRLARYGPGWCVGFEDLLTGYQSIGVFKAETVCVVHYIPYTSVMALREAKPELILDLYTLLGRIMARGKNRATERLSNLTDAVTTNNTRNTLMNRKTKRRLEKLGFV